MKFQKRGMCLIFFCVTAQASSSQRLDYRPPMTVSSDELLALPAANRVEVARMQAAPAELEKIAFSKDRDYGDRWKALTLAAQVRGPRAEPMLKKAIEAPEWFMRNAALLAYNQVLPQKVRPVAEKLLNDKALVVRAAAAQVLSQKLDRSARELLWEQLGKENNFRKKQSLFIRSQILKSLATDPKDTETNLFVRALHEQDPNMQAGAIKALERLTSQKMGKPSDTVAKQRDLWIKWAKNNVEAP